MESEMAIIPVRSKRQAMDWSLVLVSQGIESTVNPPSQNHGWQLLVSHDNYPQALSAIRQYRAENPRAVWRQTLGCTGLMFDWRSGVWLLVLVLVFMLSAAGDGRAHAAGRMDNEAVRAGQWWRLFTAVMLHGDAPHLVANVTTGFLLLGLAMGSFGPGFGLLGSYLA